MEKDMLMKRTKKFAVRIIKFANKIPNSKAGRIVEDQLVRCGTSVGSNFRSTKTAKSTRDFIHKLNIVYEEADESQFWLELLVESELMKEAEVADIYDEAKQITAMTVASIKTAKKNKDRRS